MGSSASPLAEPSETFPVFCVLMQGYSDLLEFECRAQPPVNQPNALVFLSVAW